MRRDSTESAASSSPQDDADDAGDESDQTRLDADTAFDLLSSRRRRFVVSSLRHDDWAFQRDDGMVQRDDGMPPSDDGTFQRDESVPLTSLAERVAVREEETTPEEVADEIRRNCRVSLHHVHLPKLADAGLVEYDASDNRVRPTEKLDKFAEFL